MRADLLRLLPLCSLLLVGCYETLPIDAGGDAGTDGGSFDSGGADAGRVDAGPPRIDGSPPSDAGPPDAGTDAAGRDAGTDAGPLPPGTNSIDLLLMVDNSNSMTEEQASLTAEFPRLVNILASGDFDQDGSTTGPDDFLPFDLQVGVVTSDMGTGGFTVPTCSRSNFGDDGILRTQGRTDITGCLATYPSFMRFVPGAGGDPATFARDVACVATVGTGGCGFEQPLESILKGLSPASPTSWTASGYAAPTFFRGTFGHADTSNAGFVRAGSVLAIIPVSDEEDCSARDPELFNPSSAVYGATDLNLRCFAHARAALHPVTRFVDGLMQLRATPSRLVYAPIVGIPVDLAPTAGASPDYVALISPDLALRDDRMEERIDPGNPNRLIPSCNTPGSGVAFPPIRLVQVAQQLEAAGAGVTVQSICQGSFRNGMIEIIRRAAAAAGP